MTPRRVIQRKDGYRHVYMPDHPSASPRGYVYERLARRKCVYCSAPVTRGIACRGHRDLPNLDPHYSETA